MYIIDTGVFAEHEDFEGRVRWGANFVKTDPAKDLNGHGTHCAGTVAGKKYGVAKKANIIAVKVLDGRGSGSMSDVVKGVEFAIKDHKARSEKEGKMALSAANMSLGGGMSPTLNRAVNAAVKSGIHFAVAAGNDNANACNYSPASADAPVTVGASTKTDAMAYFSNHGKCVDVFAPGYHILSTWIGESDSTNVISGTSMASPHIAGLLALHVSVKCRKDGCTTAEIKEDLIKQSTKNALHGLPTGDEPRKPKWPFPWDPPGGGDDEDEGETPNRLAYVIDIDESDRLPEDEEPNQAEFTNGGYKVTLERLESVDNPVRQLVQWFVGDF